MRVGRCEIRDIRIAVILCKESTAAEWSSGTRNAYGHRWWRLRSTT